MGERCPTQPLDSPMMPLPLPGGCPPPARCAELAPLSRAPPLAGAGNAGEAFYGAAAKALVHWYCTEKGA